LLLCCLREGAAAPQEAAAADVAAALRGWPPRLWCASRQMMVRGRKTYRRPA